jgi:hypothetical protein
MPRTAGVELSEVDASLTDEWEKIGNKGEEGRNNCLTNEGNDKSQQLANEVADVLHKGKNTFIHSTGDEFEDEGDNNLKTFSYREPVRTGGDVRTSSTSARSLAIVSRSKLTSVATSFSDCWRPSTASIATSRASPIFPRAVVRVSSTPLTVLRSAERGLR